MLIPIPMSRLFKQRTRSEHVHLQRFVISTRSITQRTR
jgi:hypothetical protein